MTSFQLGRYAVEVSNLDKVFFPEDEITKGDVVDYYKRIADTMLPHLKDRPLSMHRWPDGIDGQDFYQKEAGDYFPAWIRRVTIPKKGGENTQVICDNVATLVYLANQASLTQHVWLSRADDMRKPDRLVFDLDPPGDDDFDAVRSAARQVGDLLDEIGLTPFFQLTGSKGIHVVAPLKRDLDFDGVRKAAMAASEVLAARSPDELTTEQRKDKRKGRVYLDVMRNSYAQTMVAPYSVRARPGAPVATPIERDELSDSKLDPRRYTISNIFRRLAQRDDPWKDIDRAAASFKKARERIEELRSAEIDA